VPIAEIRSSKYANRSLLKLFRSVVKRKHGSKLLIIKFHLCLHFLENQLDYGVTANVDTGPMESNYKQNAKQPSGQTQRRAESIELQTAQRYIDKPILDKAKSAVDAKHPCNVKAPKTPTLVGAKYTLQLHSGMMTIFYQMQLLFGTNTLESKKAIIHGFLSGFAATLSELGPNIPICGCADYK
jgi:hypothetical protein